MMYLESKLNRASRLRQIKAELEFEDKQEALSYTADGMKSLTDTINSLVDAEKIYSGVSDNAGKTLRDIINNLQVNFSELQKCYSYMTGKQPDDAILKEEEDFEEKASARRFKALRSRLNRLRRSSAEDFNDPNYVDEINQQDLDQLEQEYEDSLAKERFKRERINRYNYPDDDFYDNNELYSRCRSRLNKLKSELKSKRCCNSSAMIKRNFTQDDYFIDDLNIGDIVRIEDGLLGNKTDIGEIIEIEPEYQGRTYLIVAAGDRYNSGEIAACNIVEVIATEAKKRSKEEVEKVSKTMNPVYYPYGFSDRSRLNRNISDYRDDGTEKKYKQFFPEVLMKELQNTFPKVNLELLENDGENITLGIYENENYDAQLVLANADPESNKELAYVVYVEDKKDNQNILNGGSSPRYISFADLTNDTKRSEYFKEVKAFIDNLNKDDTEEK